MTKWKCEKCNDGRCFVVREPKKGNKRTEPPGLVREKICVCGPTAFHDAEWVEVIE
jgi:hypothetical protein